MKILVGSQALKQHIDLKREPHDIDFFCDSLNHLTGELIEEDGGGKKVELFYHQDLERYFKKDEDRVATLDELYTIKISHIFWQLKNNSWNKHCHDIMLMKANGAKFIQELYDVLYPVWEEKHGKKKANLNASPEDFFNSKVTRIYEHDSIHDTVAFYDEPLFNRILADGHQVKVDRQKFEDLSQEDKLKLVREEVFATALERQIIPSNYRYSPGAAYRWALMKTITSFSKGWFPLYIVQNLDFLWSNDIKYIDKHKQNRDKLVLIEG